MILVRPFSYCDLRPPLQLLAPEELEDRFVPRIWHAWTSPFIFTTNSPCVNLDFNCSPGGLRSAQLEKCFCRAFWMTFVCVYTSLDLHPPRPCRHRWTKRHVCIWNCMCTQEWFPRTPFPFRSCLFSRGNTLHVFSYVVLTFPGSIK